MNETSSTSLSKKYMIIRFVYLFVYSSKNILVVAAHMPKIKLVFAIKAKVTVNEGRY